MVFFHSLALCTAWTSGAKIVRHQTHNSKHEGHRKLLQIVLKVLHVCQRLSAEDDCDPRAHLVAEHDAEDAEDDGEEACIVDG